MPIIKNHHLEYSQNTHISGQNLLFDSSKKINRSKKYKMPQEFYNQGYVLIKNIKNLKEAQTILEKYISAINPKELPLYSKFINKIQLAKVDLIPVCHDIVPRTFQALHFDMGQPIISKSTQSMYVILALYKPKNSTPSSAKTRIVNVKNILSQQRCKNKKLTEKRLINYVQNHGDGWTKPDRVNTLRLACFARIIDAITQRHQLINEIDNTTGQWFEYKDNSDGFTKEKLFFSKCGFNLELVEQQINIKQKQLLIINNMRCIHGRIGPRKPKEIYQFLYGVKSATPSMINDFRKWQIR